MNESRETLAALQALMDDSARTAGSAIAMNFIGWGWRMSVEEFVAFWNEPRMASIATVSGKGAVHAAPVEITLLNGRFHVPTFAYSQRLRDHRANPRCVITSWDGPYPAVIIYGTAEIDASSTAVTITPTRIYAIRPPEGHPAYRPPAG